MHYAYKGISYAPNAPYMKGRGTRKSIFILIAHTLSIYVHLYIIVKCTTDKSHGQMYNYQKAADCKKNSH